MKQRMVIQCIKHTHNKALQPTQKDARLICAVMEQAWTFFRNMHNLKNIQRAMIIRI